MRLTYLFLSYNKYISVQTSAMSWTTLFQLHFLVFSFDFHSSTLSVLCSQVRRLKSPRSLGQWLEPESSYPKDHKSLPLKFCIHGVTVTRLEVLQLSIPKDMLVKVMKGDTLLSLPLVYVHENLLPITCYVQGSRMLFSFLYLPRNYLIPVSFTECLAIDVCY